ncbi:SLBB domain-containing protein [Candidatus Marinimicrobia bacterium]|nr:SLBB domain-containing protein [Candidatus Neomarinimicrobiota bacterium]
MKNIHTIFILFLSTIFAQVSMSDINKLSNQQLDAVKKELQASTKEKVVEKINTDLDASSPVLITSTPITSSKNNYFGYDYLKKDISFFDNIPTPADYKLGPGDEIIVSLWGETNSRKNMIINKDGMIFYDNIGFINLSNQTLTSAEKILTEELSRIYSTLKDEDNPSQLMLSLGKLKSINIYFSGHIENPGINLVHPFSDIFSAIVQAGGINDKGSLREVKLIRNDQVIITVDFYSFFMNGKNTFSNTKLIDGDVIHIPNVKKRVSISGRVNRPSTYELLYGESISDIITYASGFKSDASSSLILSQITPVEDRFSDDNARTNIAINFKNKESIILNNGDSITVPSISLVDLNVTIFGRVKSPGSYPGVNTTLKNVLDIAGGFDDPIFRKTIREDSIIILRRDKNQFYSKEIKVDYKNADQFKLEVNDKIFVYEDINYNNNFTYRVEGEIFRPGTYPFGESKITVGEAISLAGGLTELSSERNLTVKQEFTVVDDEGNEITTSEPVNNVSLDFEIGINSVIIASPFENVVRVEGNVYNPGLVAYDRGLTMSKAIVQAGGYKPYSMKKRAYVIKANGEVDKANLFRGRTKRLSPGDTVVVPLNPDPSNFDFTAFISDISTTLANIAAILLIVDNQKD